VEGTGEGGEGGGGGKVGIRDAMVLDPVNKKGGVDGKEPKKEGEEKRGNRKIGKGEEFHMKH